MIINIIIIPAKIGAMTFTNKTSIAIIIIAAIIVVMIELAFLPDPMII
jgi:hypothetical protein